jgi:hypothetical protein
VKSAINIADISDKAKKLLSMLTSKESVNWFECTISAVELVTVAELNK